MPPFVRPGGGRRVVYGTDDGIYLSDLREANRDPVKVLALLDVSQVDVLEEYQLLIVLSGKRCHIRANILLLRTQPRWSQNAKSSHSHLMLLTLSIPFQV